MTGTECFAAALALLGETRDSGAYYETFALPALHQLLCNCLRESNALRESEGLLPLPSAPRMETLSEEIPADDMLVRECFPYGLAALLTCDDDKEKFNWAGKEFSSRLLAYCPASMTAVQEMI